MKLPRLTIAYPNTDEEEVLEVTPRAEVLWERHFKVPYLSFTIPMQTRFEQTQDAAEAFQTLEMDHLYYLAYCAKTKCEGVEYEDWLDTIAAVRLGADEPEGDERPLDRTPEPGKSQTSPSPADDE